MIQLEFFASNETIQMKEEIRKLNESHEKVRKSLFAKNGELTKKYVDVIQRLEILERNICQGKIQVLPILPKKNELVFNFAQEA